MGRLVWGKRNWGDGSLGGKPHPLSRPLALVQGVPFVVGVRESTQRQVLTVQRSADLAAKDSCPGISVRFRRERCRSLRGDAILRRPTGAGQPFSEFRRQGRSRHGPDVRKARPVGSEPGSRPRFSHSIDRKTSGPSSVDDAQQRKEATRCSRSHLNQSRNGSFGSSPASPPLRSPSICSRRRTRTTPTVQSAARSADARRCHSKRRARPRFGESHPGPLSGRTNLP
jgi:hypothetical protein